MGHYPYPTPVPMGGKGNDGATLTALDRCDRCGAQALVLVMLPSAGVLTFCGHHVSEHATGLVEAGAVVLADDRKAVA